MTYICVFAIFVWLFYEVEEVYGPNCDADVGVGFRRGNLAFINVDRSVVLDNAAHVTLVLKIWPLVYYRPT